MPEKDLLFTEMDLNPFAETSSNDPEDMKPGESTAEYMSRKEEERRAAEAAATATTSATGTAGITDESSRMIEETYDPVIKDFGQQIKDWEDERKRLKEQDETAQRRSRSMKMIAGISDGLTALSNLIGVAGVKGAHASNQQLTGALPAISDRFERARLERKADIKTIGDRVEQAQRQFDALRLQKGQSLAELDAQERIAEAKLASEEKGRQQKWAQFLIGEQGRDRRAALSAESKETVAEIRANTPRTGKNNKGEDIIEFDLADGEVLQMPKKNWDDVALASVYQLIPEEDRTRVPETSGGIPVYSNGQPVYKTPTKNEMLSDVVKAAKTNADVQEALKSRAKAPIYHNL